MVVRVFWIGSHSHLNQYLSKGNIQSTVFLLINHISHWNH